MAQEEKRKRVLLVEDEPAVAGMLMEMITDLGYDVSWFSTAQLGYERLLEKGAGHFAVVLSDNNTGPGSISGLEFLKFIRRHSTHSSQKFVLMSGDERHEGRHLSNVAGEKGAIFLQKPLGLTELRRAGF
jgi:DNA-binding response OmpR family regulator